MANPLTIIDNLVGSLLTGFADLTAVVPVAKIQLYNRVSDMRGDFEDNPDLGKRLFVVPAPSLTWPWYSSGSLKFERRYRIGYGTAGLDLEKCREIEWLVTRALLQDYSLLPPLDTTPLQIQSILMSSIDSDREPLYDPQEWTGICEVMVTALAPRASVKAGPP